MDIDALIKAFSTTPDESDKEFEDFTNKLIEIVKESDLDMFNKLKLEMLLKSGIEKNMAAREKAEKTYKELFEE